MPVTLIYDEKPTAAAGATVESNDLWLPQADLPGATGWLLKPEGVCRDDVCIPVPDDRRAQLLNGDRFNLSEFARLIEQPVAHDNGRETWYFGQPSWEWKSRLSEATAPDFTLPDFSGQEHSLAEYRGKKVFLLAWASWCSCRFDLPIWNSLREELKDQNFELITVACESKGQDAAQPWIDAAQPVNPSLLDEHHLVPELYNTRNVPAAFWIDEGGQIVRANDPIYAQRRKFENGQVTEVSTNERYLDAVRDWVANGPDAHYVKVDNDLKDGIGEQTWENAQAMAHFRLGLYLNEQDRKEEAIDQFKQAHALAPDNWNYKRQAWNLSSFEDYGITNIREAITDPKNPPFYRKVNIAETPV